jgi:oxygen-independent coproporphyrinogen-3 oxidase
MNTLKTQIEYELKRFSATAQSIETIFIGGGTPSTISSKLYKPIFDLLKPYLGNNIEITSEANPNSATYEWLEGMYRLGVNRISFGVQSFNAEKLKVLNRAHTAKQAKEAIQNAYKIGFKNLSLDLIYATAGDTKELLQHDINEAFSLPINHISAYALTIEEGTVFETKPQMSKEKLELTNWFFEEITCRGFKQYEISNFGTYQSTHNLGYWLYRDYIGAGSGAVGKLREKRFYPTCNIEEYIDNPLDIREEILNEDEQRLEKIFLGLRSEIGIDNSILNKNELKQANLLVEEKKNNSKKCYFL